MTDRLMIQTLAFAAREFDRLYGSLVEQEEPGPQEIAPEAGSGVASEASKTDPQADSETDSGTDSVSPGESASEPAAPHSPGDSPGESAAPVPDVAGPGEAGESTGSEPGDPAERQPESRGLLRGAAGAAGTVVGGAASLVVGAARLGARTITGTVHPRAREWSSADTDTRIAWWQGRLSTAVAALAALPSATGRLGQALGVVDAIGASGQILMANAVGRELGADLAERVRVSGLVALGETIPVGEITEVLASGEDDLSEADADDEAVDAEDGPRLGRLGQTARLVRTVAGRVRRLRSSLGERQRGGLLARVASNLPVVGAAGGFLAERGGMKRAADAARRAYTT
ncbi:hypothetical protein [Piscicoccus intestinalis]|uniref:hypothetical protein n=1 Tax=Piscicoccus intestinalis TaxID=746033 RepID=UPI00083815CC|nr:hypothetical protein [Piscicoccus intestinalis]